MKKKTGSADQWIQFIGKDKLQTFQDNFARAYGVSMIFLDMDGNPLTVGSQNSLFCFTIQKEHAVRCQENFQMDMDTMQKGESFIHVCPFGIACLYVPVYFNNRLTAFAGIGGLTYENSTIPENLKQRFHITSYNKETTWNILMLLESMLRLLNVNCTHRKMRRRNRRTRFRSTCGTNASADGNRKSCSCCARAIPINRSPGSCLSVKPQ